MNADEATRRKSNTDRLREFFLARPLKWIDAVELEPVAGRQAWRSRVSDLRKQLEQEGHGTIVNRQFHPRHVERDDRGQPARLMLGPASAVVSQYMFRPQPPQGRDAATPSVGLPLFDDGPWSQR